MFFLLLSRNKGFETRHRLSESYQKRLIIKFALRIYSSLEARARSREQLVVFETESRRAFI